MSLEKGRAEVYISLLDDKNKYFSYFNDNISVQSQVMPTLALLYSHLNDTISRQFQVSLHLQRCGSCFQ